jgi:DNA-binding CsgD family transcriptional regulator
MLATDADEAEAAFDEAMAGHAALDTPFEAARTELVHGERRRELGIAHADQPLRRALVTFEGLQAEPWAARAQALLGPPAADDAVVLTRQERQVAAIVGTGHTNREAADQLFVSPRTIDFHLRNIYKKVGIRSRTELAVWLANQEADPTDAEGVEPRPGRPPASIG